MFLFSAGAVFIYSFIYMTKTVILLS